MQIPLELETTEQIESMTVKVMQGASEALMQRWR